FVRSNARTHRAFIKSLDTESREQITRDQYSYMDGDHVTDSWDGDGSPVSTIVDAIAAVSEQEPAEVETTLHTAIDPDALEHLFESFRKSTHQNGSGRVDFTCDGHQVTALSSGEITVREDTTSGTPDEVASEEAFQLALTRLIREAEDNDVDVEGGWACHDESDPEWGIEIYQVR
ncbi:MAG TPA: HalOD1 output domain-containing protein, partial [Methanomicrobiales archaeon]|nr:HalOD1 output domain-containing protein [Methanomicrobiales archaeon]